MRYPTIAAMTLSLALAACSSGEDEPSSGETISTEEVAERARDAVRPEPGLYRSSVELLEVDMPGMGTANMRMKATHQRIGDCTG